MSVHGLSCMYTVAEGEGSEAVMSYVMLVYLPQVVVDSGVIPKLVPLLNHNENRVVVSCPTQHFHLI